MEPLNAGYNYPVVPEDPRGVGKKPYGGNQNYTLIPDEQMNINPPPQQLYMNPPAMVNPMVMGGGLNQGYQPPQYINGQNQMLGMPVNQGIYTNPPIQIYNPHNRVPVAEMRYYEINSNNSQLYTCPICQKNVSTVVHYESGSKTHMMAFFGCLFGACFCCCLVPYCMTECQDSIHFCPECDSQLGRKCV